MSGQLRALLRRHSRTLAQVNGFLRQPPSFTLLWQLDPLHETAGAAILDMYIAGNVYAETRPRRSRVQTAMSPHVEHTIVVRRGHPLILTRLPSAA